MASLFGRKVVAYKLNNSGSGVIAGDVVVPDTTADNAFTTTNSAAATTGVWVADETIASGATGRVVLEGHVTLINVTASVTRGHTATTSTTVKKAVSTGATTRTAGTFAKFTTGGTTPEADIWPADLLGTSLSNPMTTKGDIILGDTGGTPSRLAAGTATYVLTSAGAGAFPTWSAPSVGTTPGMVQLAQTVLSGSATNITFSSISASYETLRIVLSGRTDRALGTDNLRVQFNGDTAANYDYNQWDNGTSGGTGQLTGQASINIGAITGNSATAGWQGMNDIVIPGYARTVFHKVCRGNGYDPNPNNASACAGIWHSTAAINAVKLFPQVGANFLTGTVATLYGLL